MSRERSIWKRDFFKIFLYFNKASYTCIWCGMIFSESKNFFFNILSPSDLSQDICRNGTTKYRQGILGSLVVISSACCRSRHICKYPKTTQKGDLLRLFYRRGNKVPWRIREVISNIQPGRYWFGNMNFFWKIYVSIRLLHVYYKEQADIFNVQKNVFQIYPRPIQFLRGCM